MKNKYKILTILSCLTVGFVIYYVIKKIVNKPNKDEIYDDLSDEEKSAVDDMRVLFVNSAELYRSVPRRYWNALYEQRVSLYDRIGLQGFDYFYITEGTLYCTSIDEGWSYELSFQNDGIIIRKLS